MSAWRRGLACCVLISTTVAAQQRPRDTAAEIAGTASLAGVVTSDEPNSRPLRRVAVTLTTGDLSGGQSTVTDDAGRFVFQNLKGGNYSIVATRLGYVTAYYGARRPGRGPGVPVAVLDAQRVTGLSIKMLRGGVVTGTVRSPNGQPVVGRPVQVMLKGDGQLEQLAATAGAGNMSTDDRGVYRAFGLAPGEYLVIVRSPTASVGGTQDLRQVTSEELAWADQQAAGRGGAAPGAAPTYVPPPAPGQTVAYASIYYPGTTDPSAAAVVGVAAGEERSGIDITTSLVPTARVTGTVYDVEGRPSNGTPIQVQSVGGGSEDDFIGAIMGRGSARSGADGRFVLTNVAPGRYRLIAKGAAPRPATAGAAPARSAEQDAMAMVLQMLPGGGGSAFWAQEDITVDGRDISDIALRMQPGMTVSGRIVYEGATDPAPDPSKARVMVMNIPDGGSLADTVSAMTSMTMATATADGTFVVKGLTPSRYRVSLLAPQMMLSPTGTPGGWVLKSAMLNGRDVADLSFELKPSEDVGGLVITMTNRPTELSGAVIDTAGRPVPGFPIVIFSTDKAYWTFGSRRVQQARPASDGKYRVTGLPAGEYYVCAVTDLNQQELYRPSFLEQLVPGSFKLTLTEGEKKTQDLKLGSGG